jgi:hypothetical protein
MSLASLSPNGTAGWIGIALIGGTALYHKSLGSLGLLAGFGIGIYLYFVADDSSS